MNVSTVATAEASVEGLANGDALYEVVNGKRMEMPPMSMYSVWLAGRLSARLATYVEEHGLGWAVPEGLFILDAQKNTRRRPDVAFVSARRWPLDREMSLTGDCPVVPALAVEVSSPNDLVYDVINKIFEYFSFDVEQVWLVLPSVEQVYIYSSPTEVRILTKQDELDGGTLIPGFKLALADLFKRSIVVSPATPSEGVSQ